MIYILAGVLSVLWAVAAFILVLKVLEAIDGNSNNVVLTYIIASVFFSLSMAGLFYLSASENKKGPCVKYETQMHYNPSLKMMMPAKVCVQRGEWVGEEQLD